MSLWTVPINGVIATRGAADVPAIPDQPRKILDALCTGQIDQRHAGEVAPQLQTMVTSVAQNHAGG